MLRMVVHVLTASVLLAGVSVSACSSFFMPKTLGRVMSGRTMDFGTEFGWDVLIQPRCNGTHAYLGVDGQILKGTVFDGFASGINEYGVSCEIQTLVGTKYQARYPPTSKSIRGVAMNNVCTWVLQKAKKVQDAVDYFTSPDVVVYGPGIYGPLGYFHFVFRDSSGAGAILEYEGGVAQVYDSSNDLKKSPGIMTNEPFYHWHRTNVELLKWKRTLRRPAVATPGNYYPDERFLRLFLLKQGLGNKTAIDEADAVRLTSMVLDSVHVPSGTQQTGTDSGSPGSGSEYSDGINSHTQWSLIYDFESLSIYWRTNRSPSYQRLSLNSFDISMGAPVGKIDIRNTLPFYIDATANVSFKNKTRPPKEEETTSAPQNHIKVLNVA